jgi:GNAT superfamily N-acetyltransferase
MESEFRFERGNVADFLSVIDGVIDWCDASGKPMWKKADIHSVAFLSALDPDSVVVLKHGADLAAAMILQWVDPVFWPDARPDEAGYVHKLCVDRRYAGRDLSRKMLAYAKSACATRGVRLLRLDTDATRPVLRSLYERNGFALVGLFDGAKRYCLYEARL